MPSDTRNVAVCQNFLVEKTRRTKDDLNLDSFDEAFLLLTAGLLFNLDYDDIPTEEIVDARQDKQVDIVHIEEDEEANTARVHIVQVKNVQGGFSSTKLIQLRNGLSWIFEQPNYRELDNKKFVNKIGEIREIWERVGTSGLDVYVYYVTNGDTRELPDEFKQELEVLQNSFSTGFGSFKFELLGAYELFERLRALEREKQRIDARIAILYDQNQPSLIEYRVADTKAVICTISGRELARIASLGSDYAIFDLNPRIFQGTRGKVNNDIRETATSQTEAQLFWFLNNGITMICDEFDITRVPKNYHIQARNLQIVNGCQTTVTLREAMEDNELQDSVQVLVRIYATQNPILPERITLTTNNQNKISERDLRANDDVQRNIQKAMEEHYGYFYERKPKEFGEIRGERKKRVIPNEKAAQAYLAIVRKKPSRARGYRAAVWSDYYREIFNTATVEDLIACFKIYAYCYEQGRSRSKSDSALSQATNEVAVYGAFHVARIMGNLLVQDKWGNSTIQGTRQLLKDLETRPGLLSKPYEHAAAILTDIWIREADENPTLYFKAERVQRQIEEALAEMRQ